MQSPKISKGLEEIWTGAPRKISCNGVNLALPEEDLRVEPGVFDIWPTRELLDSLLGVSSWGIFFCESESSFHEH